MKENKINTVGIIVSIYNRGSSVFKKQILLISVIFYILTLISYKLIKVEYF